MIHSTRKTIAVGAAMTLAVAFTSLAGQNEQPVVCAIDFRSVKTSGHDVLLEHPVEWIRSIVEASGQFDESRHAWRADDTLARGQGRLVIQLNRDKLPSDLALTLIYEETDGSDVVVQLWDDNGQVVAPDLFSNIITAGREAHTDTFIIPFIDYPTASQVVLRRIKGDIQVYGFVLTPVACDVPIESCGADELAAQLGGRLGPDSPLVKEANSIALAQQRSLDWANHTVQHQSSLCEINEIGCEALKAESYPPYIPCKPSVSGQPFFSASGTAGSSATLCVRQLSLFHPGAFVNVMGGKSSIVQWQMMQFPGIVGIMSVSMSTAAREQYHDKYGFNLIEVPVALSAIDVFVNAENPVTEITIPQLDAIYGKSLLAGAPALVNTWGDLGAGGDWANGQIIRYGASDRSIGTVDVFCRLVLQGGPFRADIIDSTNSTFGALMDVVATNRFGIGFANYMHRSPELRSMAIAANSGQPAYLPDAKAIYARHYPLTRFLYLYSPPMEKLDPVSREMLNLIYSREGQSLIARAELLPIGGTLVKAAREKLGLDGAKRPAD